MCVSFVVTTIVKSLSVVRGFRAALLDPGCHPIFGIIGENTMEALRGQSLPKPQALQIWNLAQIGFSWNVGIKLMCLPKTLA